MKKVLVLLFLMCLSRFLQAQKRDPAIWVYSVNMYTRTIVNVSCDGFMKAFEGRIDSIVCYSKDSLDEINTFLKSVRYRKNAEDIDARVKFEYVSPSGKVNNICMDLFEISLNGRIIENFPEFYKYLSSLVPKRQLVPKGR